MSTINEFLTGLAPEPEEKGVDYSQGYADNQEFFPPMKPGKDTFRMGKPSFKLSDDKKHLNVELTHEVISDGLNKGSILSFDFVSTKTFERKGKGGVKINACSYIDQLRAFGDFTPYPTTGKTPAEAKAAMEALVKALSNQEGKTWVGTHDWSAYCSDCGKRGVKDSTETKISFNKQTEFPVDASPNGVHGHSPKVKCGVCGKELYGRTRVKLRIVEAPKTA